MVECNDAAQRCNPMKVTSSATESAHPENTPVEGLVGLDPYRKIIFTDETTRPCYRTWVTWKKLRYFPVLCIGRRIFCDPDKVREALEERFTIKAVS
jgi:hypothetical protein